MIRAMALFFMASLALAEVPKSIPGLVANVLQTSINPGTADFIASAIDHAEKSGAPYLILQLDTPGGLLSSTRQIVQKMLNSKVPIVVFIAPKGAQAGSAGAIITLAADVAVMAPGTNIGAAHPVGGGSGEKADGHSVMEDKITNDTAAFAESIAKTKGRNTEWAIKAVRESSSIIAEDALKNNVIDFMAGDLDELRQKLSGFKMRTPKNGKVELPKILAPFTPYPMSVKHRLVSFFADPNLAYLIMTLGGICIWLELSHPGLIFPGVVGAFCIILSLISFQLLPISYGALALIFGGMGMIVAELYLPTYGLLGVGGVVAFVVGSLFLMDTNVPEFQISLSLILPTAAVLSAVAMALGFLIMKSRARKLASGIETIIGELGEVRDAIGERPGKILVQGEIWNALSETGEAIAVGAIVTVSAIRGMVLVVKPIRKI